MWVLQGHYQSERNFTLTDLGSTKIRRLKWKNQIAELLQTDITDIKLSDQTALSGLLRDLFKRNSKPQTEISQKIFTYVDNNLNSAEAFSFIDQHQLTLDDWALIENLFGIGLFKEQCLPSKEILDLINNRQQARQQKDYKTADEIREKIEQTGYSVKDRTNQPIWQYLK